MTRQTRWRWPKAECLHENTETTRLRQWPDELIKSTTRCLDCGARHTPEGWT